MEELFSKKSFAYIIGYASFLFNFVTFIVAANYYHIAYFTREATPEDYTWEEMEPIYLGKYFLENIKQINDKKFPRI